MRFNRLCQIHRATANDGDRSPVSYVHLAGDSLVATTRYVLARVPVIREAGDEDGPIRPEAVKAACRAKTADGLATLTAADPPALAQPWAWKDGGKLIPAGAPAFTVTINARYLHDLALALGASDDVVTLDFPPGADDRPAADRAIRVTTRNDGPVGAIMPVRRK